MDRNDYFTISSNEKKGSKLDVGNFQEGIEIKAQGSTDEATMI